MGDLDRRSRKLVHGWSSGGLVVGLLPDSSQREWSGKAALELATAAAQDRLAALVLDLAPDATDLASRFGADPEPGFAQVMTGEVELSTIQHWDPVRGAYYLPGGVRVLSDKVAKSRSVEALAERVRGQEGILFVLLDQHAAEAAAEAGWLDGVVRLGQADLGGPTMFGEVTALGHLERREPAATTKPWEREERGATAPEPPAGAGEEPAESEIPAEPVDAGAPGDSGDADLTVEPAASAETDGGEGPAEPEVAEPRTPLEVSEEAWEPDVAARTDVLDRPATDPDSADEDRADDPSVIDLTDAAPEPPVLEVPDGLWEPREVEEPGITDEPEIVVKADEVEAEEEEPAEPEVAETAEEPADEETADGAEVEAEEEPAGPEIVEEEKPEEEILETEVGAEPEITETPAEEADSDRQAAEVVDTDEVAESEIEPEPDDGAEELEVEERPAEREVADGSEVTESSEETAEEELDRPVGLERFAEIPDEAEAPETEEAPGTEEAPAAEPAAETAAADGAEDVEEETEEAEEDEEPEEPVHAEVITSGLDVWPEEADEPVASGEAVDSEAADAPAPSGTEEPAAGVISAALWAAPEENGEPRPAEEPERADFISPAMWFSETAGTGETASLEADSRSADVISRGRWGQSGRTEPPAESSSAPPEAGDSAVAEETTGETAGEPVETEDEDSEEPDEPQRADFILDGLELPPEWSEEWEEEERAAAESRSEEEDEQEADEGEQEDGPEAESEEAGGQADFVTQGMGIPDDGEDDPWPDSGTSGDAERNGSGTGGGTWGQSSGAGGDSWERDPYGGAGGRAAAGTARAGDRGGSSGLALQRRGADQGGLWKRARKAVLVILAVGAVGALGSAVLESGAVSALRDVVATAGSGGSGDGSSSGVSGSGDVAAAGAGGPGAAAAAADSSRSSSPPSRAQDGEPETSPTSTAGAPQDEAAPRPVSDAPGFRAVTDSLAASIEDYDEQIGLYREGTIGCPLLMSAREEAGRLFGRLSAFRLSDDARADSVFRRTYRRFSEDMETVEGTYRQTDCPRPSTAPRESAAAELSQQGAAPADSSAADGVSGDTAVTAAEELPAAQAVDTTPPSTDTGADSASAGGSTDSTSGGEPADSTTSGT